MGSFEKIYDGLGACRNNCYLEITPTSNGYSIIFVDSSQSSGRRKIEIEKSELRRFFTEIANVSWSEVGISRQPIGPDPVGVVNNGKFRIDRLQRLFEKYHKRAPHYRIALYYDASERRLQFDHAVFDSKMTKKEVEELLRKIRDELKKQKESNRSISPLA